MRRREFIKVVGTAAVTWPFVSAGAGTGADVSSRFLTSFPTRNGL